MPCVCSLIHGRHSVHLNSLLLFDIKRNEPEVQWAPQNEFAIFLLQWGACWLLSGVVDDAGSYAS